MTANHRAPRARRVLGLVAATLLGLLLLGGTSSAAQEILARNPTYAPWIRLFGRLHVAIVHFPIGLLVTAGVIELFRAGRRGPKPGDAALACLGIGWFAAGLAAWSGWNYAALEKLGHDPNGLLWWHRWGGISVAGLAFLTWIFALLGRSGTRGWARTLFTLGLLLTTVGTAVVGHLGGSLAYGEDFLTEPFEQSAPRKPARDEGTAAPATDAGSATDPVPAAGEAGVTDASPAAVDSAPGTTPDGAAGTADAAPDAVASTADTSTAATPAAAGGDTYAQVLPIFEHSCVKCHGPRKGKGGLRLHEEDLIFRKDPTEWDVVPGHPEKSELLRRISLPWTDEDAMPSEGDPLTPEEIGTIRAWIASLDPAAWGVPAEGGNTGSAVLGDWKKAAIGPDGEKQTPVAGPPADRSGVAETAEEKAGAPESPEDAAARAAEDAVIAKLVARGALAARVAADTRDVDVSFGLLRKDAGDADLALLDGLEKVLTALDLSRTAVTDDGLAALERFPRLQRLKLDNTGIGDAGLTHVAGLTELVYLNLYGTQVTDEGLANLMHLEHLDRLYLWQTPVTDAGVAALQQVLPEVHVVRDVTLPEPAPPTVVVQGDATYDAVAGPIFAEHCVKCHGANDPGGGKRLDAFAEIFRATPAEWVVTPGKSAESELIERVKRAPGTKGAMPKKGDPLTEEEIASLASWIDGLSVQEPPAVESKGE